MRWSIFVIIGIFVSCLFPVSLIFAQEKIAAIVVDVQGDFTTAKKGSLAVPDTDD